MVSATAAAPTPEVQNLRNFQAASTRFGSSEVETIIPELPPAGSPLGGSPMPGYSLVRSSKSPFARSMAPTADVDQKCIATSPAANGFPASPIARLSILQPLNSFFIVSSAFSPSGPSKLTFPSLRIGVPWLHSSAWKNQLPVMFQPQNSGFL